MNSKYKDNITFYNDTFNLTKKLHKLYKVVIRNFE